MNTTMIFSDRVLVKSCIIRKIRSITVRITLAELQSQDSVGIDLLEILSLEGQRYMARLHLNDSRLMLLSDDQGQTRLFRSSWEVQDALGSFSVNRTDVVHSSAYHEMVGMPPSNIEPMRIKVQGREE